jgi:CDP-diacylglycerol---serine O-phosphatidyltransferase
MKSVKLIIPNLLTSLSLLSGSIAIILTLNPQVNAAEYAPCFIIVAAIFDLFDGMAARALNAKSDFGKHFDSLADLVSFGVAPAMIMFEILRWSVTDLSPESFWNIEGYESLIKWVPFIALLLIITSAIRLAKFNLTDEKLVFFRGLPTPAGALFIAGIRILMIEPSNDAFFHHVLLNLNYNIVIILVLSFLMVSGIRMISFKIKSLKFRKNIFQYILIVFSLVIFIVFQLEGLILVMGLYILLSLIHHFLYKST